MYSEPMGPVERFLSLAVRGQRSEAEARELRSLYAALGSGRCFEAARMNQVLPMVMDTLSSCLPVGELEPTWDQLLRANEQRVRELTAALEGITDRLHANGGTSAAIENGGVMLATDLPVRAFSSGDLDILVQDADWATVKDAFRREGFLPRDRRNRPTNRIEFAKDVPTGRTLWLNAGLRPFDRMWVPLRYSDRTAGWMAHRTNCRKSERIRVLAPSDALALVAVHTSLHSFIRAPGVRLHADVDRLVRDTTVDWATFLAEVKGLGLQTRAYVSLSIANGLLATPIPPTVLTELYPGENRWNRIRALLSHDGVFANGRKKLTAGRAVLLDLLLWDGNAAQWLANTAFPSPDWMRAHFAGGGDRPRGLFGLYARRLQLAVTQWRPH